MRSASPTLCRTSVAPAPPERLAASIPNCTFSRAVSPGKRLKLWKMKLTVRRRTSNNTRREAWVMSSPAITTRPAVGTSRAPMMLSSVVFPLPDGPSTTANSPSLTRRFTPSRARTSSPAEVRYARVTPSSWIRAGAMNSPPSASSIVPRILPPVVGDWRHLWSQLTRSG